MKKLFSLLPCLLLAASLTLPVLATDGDWESGLDNEEDSQQVYIQWITGEEAGEFSEDITIDPDMYQVITDMSKEWDTGAVDGQEIITYGTLIPPESTHASSVAPSWILVVLLVLVVALLAIALVAVIVILIIVLIVKAARKKKNASAEATDEDQNTNE